MKGLFFLIASLIFCVTTSGQNIYVCRGAEISFFSSALIENIEAQTDRGTSTINLDDKSIFFKVPVQSFQFERNLMQRHFNSDYMESEKYPYAEFTGKILDSVPVNKDGTYPVRVKGELTIHGVCNPYTGPGTLEVKNGNIIAKASFKVPLADHGVKIPKLLTRRIAEVVDVKVYATYQPQKEAIVAR